MTVEFTYDLFAPLADSVFQARHPTGPACELRLIEVRDLGAAMRTPDRFRRPFSLYFQAPEGLPWVQGTFELEHPATGACSVLCVPVLDGEGRQGRLYEAVFA